jgi:N5-(cytidine 5'-diphosphoramidyl)-L-glutamine hydrolase
MKRLGITQRVENIHSYNERRDCLDQRWAALSFHLGYFPVPLPNIAAEQVSFLLNNLKLDGILLSGGNSIASLNPNANDLAPERDIFEQTILNEAIKRNTPIIGVCRGMQLINVELGGQLVPISGHVAKNHLIKHAENRPMPERVNSYHSWAIPQDGLATILTPIAFDLEGNVEAFECVDKNLLGIMWHPERENPFNPLDVELIKRYLP